MKALIAIPTYNGGRIWEIAAANIRKYAGSEIYVQVIDSGSIDNTVTVAKENGFAVKCINADEFNHGGTRNLIVNMHRDEFDIVIFLTQDAIPQPDFLSNILKCFEDPMVACAYGRQLPHDDATYISKHARSFNYPSRSYVSTKDDIPKMGIKTAFTSNSFSAYRINTFCKLSGFPENTILSEDMYFAAKCILNGYKVAYCGNSMVKHSHNYSPIEEFRRYFDIGVFHCDEAWIRKEFGGAGGEGKRFLYSEFIYLSQNSLASIPRAFLHNFLKIFGYKLGQNYKRLPKKIIRYCSMHKRYWR
ncbi:hypothetical protein SB00094_03040 [Klebsiella variicola subsp. tropica]|uniref:glycosyltransferase n=1 Tax=Klebsiella variicola TaxID=244366 RepID=UPI00109C45AF|nr:glycosyltransferase family 2 protein [Klebsiella variicola]UDC27542.1 glycosyltransferase family 2 protein [Klebsiella variicola subsp. tropica]VGP59853.1 hypothetical protein SB00094_03040 [Klebsiella variicola subsp. tropica]